MGGKNRFPVRGLLILIFILIFTSALPVSGQDGQPPENNLLLVPDEHFLALHVLSTDSIYVDGLQFLVLNRVGTIETFAVTQKFPALSLTGGIAQPKACYIYVDDTNPTLPSVCDSTNTYTIEVASSDIFWYFEGRFQNIGINRYGEPTGKVCPCDRGPWAFYYDQPAAAPPTSVPAATATLIPTATLVPTEPPATAPPSETPVPTATEVVVTIPVDMPIISLSSRDIITQLEWSSDNHFIATGFSDGKICLWEATLVSESALVCVPSIHTARITGLTWGARGSDMLASSDENGKVQVWSVSGDGTTIALTPTAELEGHRGPIRAIRWNPNAARSLLLTAGSDGKLFVWNTLTWELVRNIPINGPIAAVWDSSGNAIAVAREKAITVIDYEGVNAGRASSYGVEIGTFQGNGVDIDWDRQTGKIVSLGTDGSVWLFEDLNDAIADPCTQDLPDCPFVRLSQNLLSPTRVRFSPDGSLVAVSARQGIYVIDARDPYHLVDLYHLPGDNASPVAIAWSPDGQSLAGADSRGDIHLWTIANQALPRLEKGSTWQVTGQPSIAITDFAWNDDSERLAIVDDDGVLSIWNASTPEQAPVTMKAHQGEIRAVAWSSGQNLIATAGCDEVVNLWDVTGLQDGQITARGELVHPDCVTYAAFHPDGNVLATGGADGLLRIWNLQFGEQITSQALNLGIDDIAWNQSGTLMAAVSDTGKLAIYDMANNATREIFWRHPDNLLAMNSVEWSPDETLIASAVGDRDITCSSQPAGCWIAIWNVNSDQPRIQGFRDAYLLQANSSSIISMSWNPAQPWLASLDTGGQLIIWDALTGQRYAQLFLADEPRTVKWSPDGSRLAIGDSKGTATIYQFAP